MNYSHEIELRQKYAAQLKIADSVAHNKNATSRELDEAEAALDSAELVQRELRAAGITGISNRHESSLAERMAELKAPVGGPTIRPGAGEYSDDPRASTELRSNQRMADMPGARNSEGLRLGATVKGMVLGDWKGAEAEQRAMNEGTLSAGGYLVPTPLSAEIIDIARAQSIVMRLGATTQPMESSTLSIARITQDVVPEFVAENAVTTNSDLVLDRILLCAGPPEGT